MVRGQERGTESGLWVSTMITAKLRFATTVTNYGTKHFFPRLLYKATPPAAGPAAAGAREAAVAEEL